MPGRLIPLITNEIYHVFNRGIARQLTFTTKKGYARSLDTLKFYRFNRPQIRLSKFFYLSNERREEFLKALEEIEKLVRIISYCLMPNHFHLLLKQEKDNGISKFLSNFQNSYTRYFNSRKQKDGPLFLDQFKAVRIETDEQLLHLSRYIHLNPYSSYIVKSFEELFMYPWSSLPLYLREEKDSFVDSSFILDHFKNRQNFKRFVLDQADYQRRLKEIEHLIFE